MWVCGSRPGGARGVSGRWRISIGEYLIRSNLNFTTLHGLYPDSAANGDLPY
jgi:hypothetical protein